jgi:hypothetical protein
MDVIKRSFNALNLYFFDVQPDEPIDWASCIIYYGFLAFSIALGIALTVFNLVV